MNRRTAIWSSIFCLGLFTTGAGIAQQVNWSRHPNLAAAQRLTEQAFEKMSAAQGANEFDMGGHAQRAKDDLERANQEIQAAAGAANHR
ncbi:MAG TPA: hypothetical protein VHX60_06180 [Acidobacteriaceae bacterium]|jgi:hypothetical protein|nr:hypothetical protein [Acidobacteriaceae bacterium]